MAFFTKAEIMQRMIEKRAELNAENPARADLNLALIILGSALFEKRLKSGRDYGEHPLFVGVNNTRSIAKIVIGLLHDIVEDSDWTLDNLRTVGFPERIVSAVDAMTKREDELYFDFIERCSLNSDAIDKKIEDISHNLDQSRSDLLVTERDMNRMNKYIVSKAYLIAVKKGRIETGSSIVDFIRSRPDFKNSLTVAQLVSLHSSRATQPANDILPQLPLSGTEPSPQ